MDEHFERLVTRGTEVEILSRKGGKSSSNLGRVSAVVDLKSGKISKDDDASPRYPRQDELFGWLKEELDADTLEEFRRRWKRFKEERKQESATFAREPWTESRLDLVGRPGARRLEERGRRLGPATHTGPGRKLLRGRRLLLYSPGMRL